MSSELCQVDLCFQGHSRSPFPRSQLAVKHLTPKDWQCQETSANSIPAGFLGYSVSKYSILVSSVCPTLSPTIWHIRQAFHKKSPQGICRRNWFLVCDLKPYCAPLSSVLCCVSGGLACLSLDPYRRRRSCVL